MARTLQQAVRKLRYRLAEKFNGNLIGLNMGQHAVLDWLGIATTQRHNCWHAQRFGVTQHELIAGPHTGVADAEPAKFVSGQGIDAGLVQHNGWPTACYRLVPSAGNRCEKALVVGAIVKLNIEAALRLAKREVARTMH